MKAKDNTYVASQKTLWKAIYSENIMKINSTEFAMFVIIRKFIVAPFSTRKTDFPLHIEIFIHKQLK